MPLCVVTHNGQPPTGKSSGGKRIGYAYFNALVFLPDANVAAYLAAQEALRRQALRDKAEQMRRERMPDDEYLNLPKAGYWGNSCQCGCEDNPTIQHRGRAVVECRSCDKLMRPYR